MTRRSIFTYLLLLLATLASAQENRRLWADGPLTWADFKSVVSPDGNSSMLHYQLGYEPAEFRDENGIKGQYCRAVAWMDTDKSWVDANSRTALNLRYNQVIFDLLEVERRQMAQALAACSDAACLNTALATANANLENSIRTLRAATADGTDSNAIIAWEQSARQRLASLSEAPEVCHRLLPFSTAITLGAAYHMPGGDVTDLFSAGGGMHFGAEVGWNRHVVTMDVILASSKLREFMNFSDDNGMHQFNPGYNSTVGAGVFSYGYRIVETARFSLTPMAGWSWGDRIFSDGDSRGGISTNGVALGLAYRHHFWQRYRLPGSAWALLGSTSAEISRWSVDARIFLIHNSYPFENAKVSGWALQFSLGITLGGRATRMETR